ncbi:MAG: hypothetical protein R2991_10115 [Thermoanaerobaculia bacterium]
MAAGAGLPGEPEEGAGEILPLRAQRLGPAHLAGLVALPALDGTVRAA